MGNSDNYKRVEWRLYSYKENKIKLKNLIEEIERERNSYNPIGAMTYEERIAGTNVVNSAIESEVIRREERIQRLQQEKTKLECDIRQVDNVLEILTGEEKELIEERYFKKKTYLQLTDVFPYSQSSIHSITRKLVKRIEQLLCF